jgi:hypothetical protein
MFDLPKLTGREFRPFDWYGWMMALIGCGVMYLLIRDTSMTWPIKIISFGSTLLIFFDYVWRVAYGRVYKHVYYDTIIHTMYEIEISDERYFICAFNEEELKDYILVHYPFVGESYRIIGEHNVESFLKKELYQ